MDFDGIAIGGVSVGKSKTEMAQVLDWVYPYLPEGLPRHLLGVGEIDDIFTLIENGMDTFDCVMPSREARMGYVYLSPAAGNRSGADRKYLLDINKSGFADDQGPIDQTCKCYTCQNFSRGYLHHLFKVRELLSYRLATIHNIYFINNLVTRIRKSISEDSFIDLKKQWL
jgi:queuine tRNA-ribosyltransferase/7-cyano-7-deazaguanine tRNA-ribosyltransferase